MSHDELRTFTSRLNALVAPCARGNLLLSSSRFIFFYFFFREHVQIRNESEEVRVHRREGERDRSLSNRETFLFAERARPNERQGKRREVKS